MEEPSRHRKTDGTGNKGFSPNADESFDSPDGPVACVRKATTSKKASLVKCCYMW